MQALSLIAQETQTLQLYEKILTAKGYEVGTQHILGETPSISEAQWSIIDIKSKKGIALLKNISFAENAYIIIISPFAPSLFSDTFSKQNIHRFHLNKPIEITTFEKMLKSVELQIEKENFLKSKENILVGAIDESPMRIALYDLEGRMLYANIPYMKANGLTALQNIFFNDLKNCKEEFADIVHNVKIKEIYIIEKEQNHIWHKSFFYMTHSTKNIVHLCMEQTEEKLYIEFLKKSAQVFEKSNEGVVITDENATIIAINDSFCNITGYTKDEALGQAINILNSGTHDKDFYKDLWDSLQHHGKWQGEIWNKRKNGEIYPEWLSITKVVDQETKEITYMAIFTDITSLKDADKKLHFYANHDHLTGLLNKVQFENMLEQSLNRAVRNNSKFALLFVDLDFFKEVNDTAGHSAGDLVLKEAAKRLQNSLRKEDIIARIGGDEFNILIDNVKDESDVLLLAEKISEAIQRPFQAEGKTFYLSLSIGIALFPIHGLNGKDLAKNADAAMYEVKKNGRNGILLYNKKFTDNILKKVFLQHDLKDAIQNKDFEVYYQLVVAIDKQTIVGAEALIRWQHKEKGFISPEEFIPIAERHRLIGKIDKIVFTQACEDLHLLLRKFGEEFILAVNVSSQEFSSDGYIKQVCDLIDDFQIEAKNLELELTETYIMENHELAIEKMRKLRQHGFNLAIDDFGTGYSSLSYLKKLPVNKLKIDKSFILDILKDKDDADMVKAIIHIAKIFNLEIQAEGVETLQHLKFLQDNGVDIAQGYYYAKPMPLEEILTTKEWNLSHE